MGRSLHAHQQIRVCFFLNFVSLLIFIIMCVLLRVWVWTSPLYAHQMLEQQLNTFTYCSRASANLRLFPLEIDNPNKKIPVMKLLRDVKNREHRRRTQFVEIPEDWLFRENLISFHKWKVFFISSQHIQSHRYSRWEKEFHCIYYLCVSLSFPCSNQNRMLYSEFNQYAGE